MQVRNRRVQTHLERGTIECDENFKFNIKMNYMNKCPEVPTCSKENKSHNPRHGTKDISPP